LTFNSIAIAQPSMEPYLSSERHFRRYEQYIKTIVDSWPRSVTFTPQPPVCSVETLASRIRICIKAFRDNMQSSLVEWKVSFSSAIFLQICDEIVVSTTAQPGKVVCGPAALVRKTVPLGVAVEPIVTQTIPKVNLVDPPTDLIRAILVLHHHKFLSEPSTIHTKQPIEPLADGLDVAIDLIEPNVYTVL